MRILLRDLLKYPRLRVYLGNQPTRLWDTETDLWLMYDGGHTQDTACAGVWPLAKAFKKVEAYPPNKIMFKVERINFFELPRIMDLMKEDDDLRGLEEA